VDRGIDLVGETFQRMGASLRKLQTGFVANYALLMLAMGAFIFYLVVILTRGMS
jgi:hypothetical protein